MMADKLFGKLLDNYVNRHSSSAYSSPWGEPYSANSEYHLTPANPE